MKNKPARGQRKRSSKKRPTSKKTTRKRAPKNTPFFPTTNQEAELLTTEDHIQLAQHLSKELTEEEKKAEAPRIAARKATFIQAMIKCMGIATRASMLTGISARTHREWLQQDENYRDAIHRVRFVLKDFYEDALIQLVKTKNPAAVIFANKTINKDRGYFETLHAVNQNFEDNNVQFYIPENGREEVTPIQDAQIVNQ